MQTITPEEALALADEVRPFVESKGWAFAVSALKQDFISRIVESNFAESSVREEAYLKYRVLEDLETTFRTLLVAAENIKIRLEFETSDDQLETE